MALASLALIALPSMSGAARAASGSIAVTPATQTVAPGATFTVTLTQSSDAATTSAQATLKFDPAIVQLQNVDPGPGYAAGSLAFGTVPGSDTGDAGQPQTPEEAIASANETGALVNAAAFLQPGSGTLPPGDNVFLTLTMQAVAQGTSVLELTGPTNQIGQLYPVQLLDDQYGLIEATSTNGQVVVGAGGAVATSTALVPPTPFSTTPVALLPTATAGGAVTPAATKTASSGVLGSSKAPSLTGATIAVSPSTQKVAKESEFTFDVTQQLDGAATSVQASVSFKRDLAHVVKVEPGPGWKAASSGIDAAISDANNSGELQITLTADKDHGPPTSGESKIATVTMQGQPGKEGKLALKFVTTDIIGADGSSAPVTANSGEVIVGSAGGGSSMLLIVIGAIVAVAVVGGGGAGFWMKQRNAS